MPRTRDEHFNVRLRPDELAKLRALAEERDESASALVRRWIRERHASRLGNATATRNGTTKGARR